jgi:prepilin-type N-terminal cleavage/methylation domain-containing protein
MAGMPLAFTLFLERSPMNALATRHRRHRAPRGFTLIELMVVVSLVATISLLAVPSFVEARRDRASFDAARRYQQLLVQGRARASGTGSAHLALVGPGTSARGFIRLFEALDGSAGFPNPVSSCKQNPFQWAQAVATPVVLNGTTARYVDGFDLGADATVGDSDIRATIKTGAGTAGAVLESSDFLVLCIAPSGATYVGWGSTAEAAINAMRESPAFNGVVEVGVQRYVAGTVVGMRRILTLGGGAAPWLRSE